MNPSDDWQAGDTDEIPIPDYLQLPRLAEREATRVHVEYGAVSHPGRRATNQDRFAVSRIGRSLHTLLSNLPEPELPRRIDEIGYAMLVADGMGGAAAGDFAATLASLTLFSLALETPDWILSSSEADAHRVLDRMLDRFCQIDRAIKARAEEVPSLRGMGTTMTVACSFGMRLMLTHIGDSRAYLLRGDTLHRLTRDHTLGQRLVDQGVFDNIEQVSHRLRHVLARCLGGTGRDAVPELEQFALEDGDQLLLCTDGLTDVVSEPTIIRFLAGSGSARDASQALLDSALAIGANDNVTAVVARYRLLGK